MEGIAKVEVVDELLSQREAVFALLRQKLLKAQEHMKAIVDGHHRDHEFHIGD